MKFQTIVLSCLLVFVSSINVASSETKANWQHHQMLTYELFTAQQKNGGKASFPSIFVFNHKNQLTGATLEANRGLFKNIDFHNLPTRPLPISNKVKGVVGLITPLLDSSPEQKNTHTVVLIMPSKDMIDCTPCNKEFKTLDGLYAKKPNDKVQLKLVTAILQ